MRVALSSLARRPRLAIRGALLHVENTTYCNFRCTYCPTHSEARVGPPLGPRRHMTLAAFETILAEHPRARFVVLQGEGEPLLDPTLFAKIAAARKRGLVTQVISNGSVLGDAMRARLRAEGPDVLLFSLDAMSPARSEATRKGLRYMETMANVRRLAANRGARLAVLGLLSIVDGPFGPEAEDALARFDDLGIDVLFYKPLNQAFTGKIQGYEPPAAGRVPTAVRRRLGYVVSEQRVRPVAPCAQLRNDWPFFLASGEKTPCCILDQPVHTTPPFARDAMLTRYAARALPAECERCSFFAGYPS